jgi:hypothetical protein
MAPEWREDTNPTGSLWNRFEVNFNGIANCDSPVRKFGTADCFGLLSRNLELFRRVVRVQGPH